MSHDYPIVVMSFNRPQYLEPVLQSLSAQADCRITERVVALFQDGAVNRISGNSYAEQKDIDACVQLFQRHFPLGTIFRSSENLGVSLNFERAENYVFDTLKAEAAIFLEDDLVLSPFYITSLERVLTFALSDERVGYVAVYGHHRTPLTLQHENPGKFVLLEHNWGFGLTRRQWMRNKAYVDPYLDLVRQFDYKFRDATRIHELFATWGLGCPGDSQDVAKTLACCLTGAVKLNTQACLGKYIGVTGLHMKAEWYHRLGYEQTEMFPSPVTDLEPLSSVTYNEIFQAQMQWATEKPCLCRVTSTAKSIESRTETLKSASPEMPTPEIPLRMSAAEASLFNKKLDATTYYLEWGAGGSTLAAIRSKAQKIVSIETDPVWIERLRQLDEIQRAIDRGRLIVRHVDVGPVGEWGVPLGQEKITNWPRYAIDPFVTTDFNFDLILVDGRFRIHCLIAVANCAAPEAQIFLHDYQFRHGYTIADKYFDTIERVDSSTVLRVRKDINYRSLYIDLINSLFQA